jgi:DNA/RNA-binding domain of Phe-tRNA-synthetase-like protein
MLRNGVYKPTGRGKPASEYLLRVAKDDVGSFPRINGPVDTNNLVSLRYCVPISVWDRDLARTDEYEFRLGYADESYVFNPTGQTLALRDLMCGCGLYAERGSMPIVTPIKDSLATKLTNASTRLAACIYYPLSAGSSEHLTEVVQELLRWLLTCGPECTGNAGVCLPGQTLQL